MKINGITTSPVVIMKINPYVDIANALMGSGEIIVDSEGEFPPLSEEELAEKIQQEWGKQPGKVEVRIADNARSPECYLVRVVEKEYENAK